MCVIDRPETTGTTTARSEVRTDRLILRAPQAGDVDAITRLCGDFAIASMTSRMPHPYAEADARRFVELVARQTPARERTFAIELPGEGLIGCLGFHKAAGAPLEFGYWIGRPYWGRGFATEASRALLEVGFELLGLRRIFATCDTRNVGSWTVMQKLGMRREATFRQDVKARDGWRDSYLYAVLAEEWRGRRR
ncbi:MAG: GNAT family N-acetyltransferase [Caulobacteraceae bacterium]